MSGWGSRGLATADWSVSGLHSWSEPSLLASACCWSGTVFLQALLQFSTRGFLVAIWWHVCWSTWPDCRNEKVMLQLVLLRPCLVDASRLWTNSGKHSLPITVFEAPKSRIPHGPWESKTGVLLYVCMGWFLHMAGFRARGHMILATALHSWSCLQSLNGSLWTYIIPVVFVGLPMTPTPITRLVVPPNQTFINITRQRLIQGGFGNLRNHVEFHGQQIIGLVHCDSRSWHGIGCRTCFRSFRMCQNQSPDDKDTQLANAPFCHTVCRTCSGRSGCARTRALTIRTLSSPMPLSATLSAERVQNPILQWTTRLHVLKSTTLSTTFVIPRSFPLLILQLHFHEMSERNLCSETFQKGVCEHLGMLSMPNWDQDRLGSALLQLIQNRLWGPHLDLPPAGGFLQTRLHWPHLWPAWWALHQILLRPKWSSCVFRLVCFPLSCHVHEEGCPQNSDSFRNPLNCKFPFQWLIWFKDHLLLLLKMYAWRSSKVSFLDSSLLHRMSARARKESLLSSDNCTVWNSASSASSYWHSSPIFPQWPPSNSMSF